MNRDIVPKDLEVPKDAWGRSIDLDPDFIVLSLGNEEGVLEQLMLLLYFRGSEGVPCRPFKVTEVIQPLVLYFAGQLAINDINNLTVKDAHDAAKHLSAEHVFVVPPLCGEAVENIRAQFDKAYKSLEDWKHNSTVTEEDVAGNFEAAIVGSARLRIPEVISQINNFLHSYQEIKPKTGRLWASFDQRKRDIERSISDTKNSSIDSIIRLSTEFHKRQDMHNIVTARLLDVFARNHAALGFTSDIERCYNYTLDAYTALINSASPLGDKVSAHASSIAFELLLNDVKSAKKHFSLLKGSAPLHKKTKFIENLLAEKSQPSNLAMVGLDKYFRPKDLNKLKAKVDSYGGLHPSHMPYPAHRMTALLHHCKKTIPIQSYRVKAGGRRYMCYVFNHNPYLSFKNPSRGFSLPDKYAVLLSLNKKPIAEDISLEDCKRCYPAHKNSPIEKNLEDWTDRYCFSVPQFRDRKRSLGSRPEAIPTRGSYIRIDKIKSGVPS
jgi:hypothetical protein